MKIAPGADKWWSFADLNLLCPLTARSLQEPGFLPGRLRSRPRRVRIPALYQTCSLLTGFSVENLQNKRFPNQRSGLRVSPGWPQEKAAWGEPGAGGPGRAALPQLAPAGRRGPRATPRLSHCCPRLPDWGYAKTSENSGEFWLFWSKKDAVKEGKCGKDKRVLSPPQNELLNSKSLNCANYPFF